MVTMLRPVPLNRASRLGAAFGVLCLFQAVPGAVAVLHAGCGDYVLLHSESPGPDGAMVRGGHSGQPSEASAYRGGLARAPFSKDDQSPGHCTGAACRSGPSPVAPPRPAPTQAPARDMIHAAAVLLVPEFVAFVGDEPRRAAAEHGMGGLFRPPRFS